MKHILHFLLLSFIFSMLPLSAYCADGDDVSDTDSLLMAGKKTNAPIWQETDPSSTDPKTPYLNRRRALVGYNCQINRVITAVGVGAWTSGIENLVDDDLDNDATFPGVVGVTAAASPIVGVRDLDNYYAAGTTAGFCIVANSGTKVLSLDVVKTMHIWFYCNGKLVDDQAVREGNGGSGVKLSLIGVGNEQACVNLTAVSTKMFDEIVLVKGGGVDAEVGGVLKVKYAFVGQPHDILLTTNGVKQYCTDTGHPQMSVSCEAFMPSPLVGGIPLPVTKSFCQRAIDDDLTNTVPLISAVQLASVAFKGRLRVNVKHSDRSTTELFKAGDQVGFKYNMVEVVNLLSVGAWISVKLYDHNGDATETITVSAEGLALSLASGGDQTSYVTATKPFSGAEISFYTALGVLDLGSGFGVYYGFVRPKPTVEKHHCPIEASYGVNICDQQSTYQLRSNEAIAVKWSLIDAPEGSAVTVDENTGYVRHLDKEGYYTFRATATDGCYEDVTIHHGIGGSEFQCEQPYTNTENQYALSDKVYGSSGSLISVSNLKDKENILDGQAQTFASYTGGLALANNLMLVGVKTTDDALFFDGAPADAQPMRVGFVVEMTSTGLSLDALNLFQIRCYNGTGEEKTEVYRHAITDIGVVNLGIAGSNKAEKMRLVIEVPRFDSKGEVIRFNEFQLWKSGVLGLNIDELKIFYPFHETVSQTTAEAGCGNAIMEGSNILNYSRDHASVSAQNVGVVSVGDVVSNLSNIIDYDINLETYATIVKGVGSGQTVISVKMGHIQDFRQQVGVVVDNKQYLEVNLAKVMKVETYMDGVATGESENEWKALGVNLVQGGDKTVMLMTPSKEYNEIRITLTNGLDVLQTLKIYGIILRNDIDHDGVADYRDNSCCSNTINDMEVSNTCIDGDLYFKGLTTTETPFYFILPDQALNGQSERFDKKSDKDGFIDLKVKAYKAGWHMPVYIYDGSDKLVGTAYYNVHPLQTTWKRQPSNTDWNEWSNWTEGSPYLCTDVIIPSDAERYPSLDGTVARGDEFGCRRIHLESRAAVEKVYKLNYTDAFVDVTLAPNRYYLLTAPLQSVYSGDWFVALEGSAVETPGYFQTLDAETYKENRFSPRIWQRLWERTAQSRLANGDNDDVPITETRWSRRFNALAYPYGTGEGFSLWTQPDSNGAETFTFRLPKQHATYTYYNEVTEQPTSMTEDVSTRPYYYRFAYEKPLPSKPYTYLSENDRSIFDDISSLSVQLSAVEESQTFLVGNPFMSHIDVKAFIAANSDLIDEVMVYDGNTTSAAIAVGSELISTDETFTVIEPMEAFYVHAKTASRELTLRFTEDIFAGSAVQTSPKGVFSSSVFAAGGLRESSALRLSVSTDGHRAATILIDDASGVDVARDILFDGEVKPSLAVFAVQGGRCVDIGSLSADEGDIPLGFCVGEPCEVLLQCTAYGDADADEWVLVDSSTGEVYTLDDDISIALDGSSVGRFFLHKASLPLSVGSVSRLGDISAVTVSWQGGTVETTAASKCLARMDVLGYDGMLLSTCAAAHGSSCLRTTTHAQHGIVRIALTDGRKVEYKF